MLAVFAKKVESDFQFSLKPDGLKDKNLPDNHLTTSVSMLQQTIMQIEVSKNFIV